MMNVNSHLYFLLAQLRIQELEAEAGLERELRLMRAEQAQPPPVQTPQPSPKVKPSGQLLKGGA
jgi:hypothetical protein